MGRAAGRAFTAIGGALLGYDEQRRQREALAAREQQRLSEREEDRALEQERYDTSQQRLDQSEERRVEAERSRLLQQPGAYAHPETVTRNFETPQEEQPRTINVPPPPTLGGGPPPVPFEETARQSMFGDTPSLARDVGPLEVMERNPLPEGHTMPLPGIGFNPNFKEDQEKAQNERLSELARAAGIKHWEILSAAGPNALSALLADERAGPPPGSPEWRKLEEFKAALADKYRKKGGEDGISATSLYTHRATLAQKYLDAYNAATGDAAMLKSVESSFPFRNPQEALRVIQGGEMPEFPPPPTETAETGEEGVVEEPGTKGNPFSLDPVTVPGTGFVGPELKTQPTQFVPPPGPRPPTGAPSAAKAAGTMFQGGGPFTAPPRAPALPQTDTATQPAVTARPPVQPQDTAGATGLLNTTEIQMYLGKLQGFPRDQWAQVMRSQGISPSQIKQVMAGVR